MKTIHTHPGKPHLDDMASCALLSTIASCSIVRTRDEVAADFHVDVGGKYDPAKDFFDHHQWKWKEKEGEFINGVPCSSFGLVCKKYLETAIVRLNPDVERKSVYGRVMLDLVNPIDASDTGAGLISSPYLNDLVAEAEKERPAGYNERVTASSLWNILIPPITEEGAQDFDGGFYKGMAAAVGLIGGVVSSPTVGCEEWDNVVASLVGTYFAPAFGDYVTALRRDQAAVKSLIGLGNPIQVFSRYFMGLENSCCADKDLTYIIFPDELGWKVRAVASLPGSFTSRKALPASWRAKNNAELVAITGVQDAVFCHGTGFIAGATTLVGAFALAQKAIHEA
jgi:uncharacterized UPF0160 family protein